MIRHVVEVSLGDRSYPIYIGERSLHGFVERFEERFSGVKAAVITNATVWDFYGEQLSESLTVEDITHEIMLVRDGEEAKSLEIANRIYGELIEEGFERNDVIIALGGGVIGDLAGFIAATYQRGVPFIQVPTTLLAQVDSSVGGKVAVNHSMGKNMIGAFYQPSFVYIDVSTLASLTQRDFASGMAEVIKYACITGDPLLTMLSERGNEITARNNDVLADIVSTCCSIKARIVETDERDRGVRAYLNYGHTLAHAIEATTGYGFSHGEAVAVGMVFAARLGQRLDMLGEDDVSIQESLVESYNLPTAVTGVTAEDLHSVMKRDKKREKGGLVFVLLDGIGNPVLRKIDDDVVLVALREFLEKR
ncbi:MAG TPA: 3-dehydroquinate synthase [Candidatus Aquicultor sp.]|jgi:3-dehydroquinate synthase